MLLWWFHVRGVALSGEQAIGLVQAFSLLCYTFLGQLFLIGRKAD